MAGASRWRRAGVAAGLALCAAGALAAAEPAAAAQRPGEVYVLNAVVGSPADVVIDGQDVHPALAPKAFLGPLRVTAGKHVITLLTASGALAKASFTVAAGASVDVVAHRMADSAMSPAVTVFPNSTAPVGPGKARLVVSHVAVAPPADIRVDGAALFRNVANGESLSLVVPAKAYSVDIVPTATTGPEILAPVRLSVRAGTLTRVFAVGNPADGSADAVVQVISVPVVGSGTPRLVRTGDGGQAATSFVGGGAGWAGALSLALGGVALLVASRGMAAGRSSFGGRHTR